MERLALVADTHSYQAGLPALLAFFKDQDSPGLPRGLSAGALPGLADDGPRQPAVLGVRCLRAADARGHRLRYRLGAGGPDLLAHTRALIWTHFNERIRSYGHRAHSCRLPILACHGHTHVPSVTRFTPPFSRLLYTNDAVRPQEFQARQACLALDPDTTYLIVPGAFTLEEQRHPTFSFAVLDLVSSRVAMVSLKDLRNLKSVELFPPD